MFVASLTLGKKKTVEGAEEEKANSISGIGERKPVSD